MSSLTGLPNAHTRHPNHWVAFLVKFTMQVSWIQSRFKYCKSDIATLAESEVTALCRVSNCCRNSEQFYIVKEVAQSTRKASKLKKKPECRTESMIKLK